MFLPTDDPARKARIAAGILIPTLGARLWRGTDINVLPPEQRRNAALKIHRADELFKWGRL